MRVLRKGRHAFLWLQVRVVLMHRHILLVRVGHVMWVEVIRSSSVGVEATVVSRMSVPISIGITPSRLHLIVLLGQLFTLMIR